MTLRHSLLALGVLLALPSAATAQVFQATDGSIQGSLCVGDDCLANEVFGNDTLRLKGQDVRLHFEDTSTEANFSQSDWRILINSDAAFGENFFAVEDATAVTVPFKIKSSSQNDTLVLDTLTLPGVGTFPRVGIGTNAPTSALHIVNPFNSFVEVETTDQGIGSYKWTIGATGDSFGINDVTGPNFNDIFTIEGGGQGRVFIMAANRFFGFNEVSPQMELHVTADDTPTLRLEQSDRVNPETYTWDIGGNEANFFVRDLDAASLPFRIRPGAPDNALYVAGNGEIGMGIPDPRGALHIRRNQPNNVPHLLLQTRRTDGRAEIWFEDAKTATDNDALRLQLNGDVFNVSFNGTGGAELAVTKTGDVRVPRGNLVVPSGGVIVGGQTLSVPDYVFAPDYALMPLAEVDAFIAEHSHLPHIQSADDVRANGLDMAEMVLSLLKSHEELTLHTIALNKRVLELEAALAAD